MKRIAFICTLTFAVGMLVGTLGQQILNAQQAPPTQVKGQTAKPVALLELGPQIPELQGRYLRARVITFEPGGHGQLHSHAERPTILYILQGTFSDCASDGKCVELHEGQAKAEGKDVVHWPANRGEKPLIYLAVDISKEP